VTAQNDFERTLAAAEKQPDQEPVQPKSRQSNCVIGPVIYPRAMVVSMVLRSRPNGEPWMGRPSRHAMWIGAGVIG
jgi:hypothetical protein